MSTLLEDGKPAGRETDENGSFSLSTEHKFANLDPEADVPHRRQSPPAPTPPGDGVRLGRDT